MKYIFQFAKGSKMIIKYAGFVLVIINTIKFFSEEIEKLEEGYEKSD